MDSPLKDSEISIKNKNCNGNEMDVNDSTQIETMSSPGAFILIASSIKEI